MQKLIWASLLAILAVIFVQGCSKSEEKIVMATAAEFPPFEYKEGNEFKGIDVEIAQEVAKILGKTLEIKDMEFDSVVSAVSSANVEFGASGLTINEARSKVVDFTTSYYNANQVVIIKNSDSELKAVGDNAAELIKAINKKNGIKIGVQTGTTGAFYAQGDKDWGFEGFKNAEVKGFVNGSLAVSALENGQIDIVIIDEAPARLISKNYANTEVLSAYLTEERYGIAVKKGNQELLDSINQALEKMRTEGVLDKIIKKVLLKAQEFMDKIEIFYNQLIVKGGYTLVVEGLFVTILLAVCGLMIGIFVGTMLAILITKEEKNTLEYLLVGIGKLYVGFFRGTPIVVQLLFIYFVILPLFGLAGSSALLVAIVIFGLNSGAYVSEIIRGGILSVDSGQNEAARALGLNSKQSMRFIVFPQALKNALPNLGNEFITLLKETSVANYVTVHDLTYAFKTIGSASYEYMIPYFFLALCYLVLVMIASFVVKKYEGKLRKSDKR